MVLLKVITSIFLILESLNVLTLYFAPGSKYANGIGVFNAWEKSKQNPEIHQLIVYLVNWVAGTKLIFILLLLVILWKSNDETLIYSSIAMVISITSFFWRLFPIIRKMDAAGHITPRNYSKTLGWMILGFIAIFVVASIAGITQA